MNCEVDNFLDTVKKCVEKRNAVLRGKAEEFNISQGEAEVMLFVWEHGADKAAEVVKQIGISKAFVSKLVIGLLSKRLITVTKDETDKRCQKIKLTPSGEEIARELSRAGKAFMSELHNGFTDEETNALKGIFKKIEHNLVKIR